MRSTTLGAVMCLTLASGLLGCTSVTTGPTDAPSGGASVVPSQVASPSASVPASPSVESVPPTSALESSPPTKTPKPPKSARPSQPSGPPAPNLVITKFVTDDDQFVVDIHSQVRITIKNEGTVDAGLFELGISFTDGVGGGGITPTPVDGLAAGESFQIPIIINPLAPGNVTYTATADSGDAVSESNEDDNSMD